MKISVLVKICIICFQNFYSAYMQDSSDFDCFCVCKAFFILFYCRDCIDHTSSNLDKKSVRLGFISIFVKSGLWYLFPCTFHIGSFINKPETVQKQVWQHKYSFEALFFSLSNWMIEVWIDEFACECGGHWYRRDPEQEKRDSLINTLWPEVFRVRV